MIHLIAQTVGGELSETWRTPGWVLACGLVVLMLSVAANVIITLVKMVRSSDVTSIRDGIRRIDEKVDRQHGVLTREIAALHDKDARILVALERRLVPIEVKLGLRRPYPDDHGGGEDAGGARGEKGGG